MAIAVSVALLTAGLIKAPAAQAAPITSASLAVLLVSDQPNGAFAFGPADVANQTVPFLNRWFGSASYGAFQGFAPAWAGRTTKLDGGLCDPRGPHGNDGLWSWAQANHPRPDEQLYVVVVPSDTCPNAQPTSSPLGNQTYVYLTDKDFVYLSSSSGYLTARAVYGTVHELGHGLFGPQHADGLDCTSGRWDTCYKGPFAGQVDPRDCTQSDGTTPYTGTGQVCAYGDPWDPMGNGFPENPAQYGVGTIKGSTRPNGIELDKVGWLGTLGPCGNLAMAARQLEVCPGVSTVKQIRPLEQASAGAPPQVLWIPAVAGSNVPRIEMEYRRPSQGAFDNWLDGFLRGCVQPSAGGDCGPTAGVDYGWPEVTDGVLLHAVPRKDRFFNDPGASQSLLIDATPNSVPRGESKLCPSGRTAPFNYYKNAFCDWYDAALRPGVDALSGVLRSFVPAGNQSPYYLTVLSANASAAKVAVNYCPCNDPFSPSNGYLGEVNQGQTKSKTFTLTNNAVGVTHTISNPSITGADSGDFSITSNNCGALAPGASCQITISFHPPTTASSDWFNAYLTVHDTNPVFPTETLYLSGATTGGLWSSIYNGGMSFNDATAVGVSPDGSKVFVTGGGGQSKTDYATIAYNASTGAELWEKRYNGPANGNDGARALGVSPDGAKVFVTGSSDGTNGDYATIAYDASTGAKVWEERYNGPGPPGNSVDIANALGVSRDGSKVFVTGSSRVSVANEDYATVAYNASTGAELWEKRYNGPGTANSVDGASALGVSRDGSKVFVTGTSDESSTTNVRSDYATVAYDASTGAERWVKRYNGSGEDGAYDLGVSRDGSKVFVTGASGYESATIAYDASTGTKVWEERYNRPIGDSFAAATELGVSPDGSKVFVTGPSGSISNDTFDYATVAYNASTGAEQWVNRYNASGFDVPHDLGVNPNGSKVFVTGASAHDYATIAYNASTGVQLSVRRYNSSNPTGFAEANALGVSPDGSMVFVTGSDNDNSAIRTVAYSTR